MKSSQTSPFEGPFSGFPEEGLRFLEELADNNDRDWFQPRKMIYEEKVVEPAQVFVSALGNRLKTISPDIRYDTQTNGRGSIMRIYRDIRFRKDKRPYEPSIRIVFWEGSGKRTESPGFYLCVEPGSAMLYAGLHGFTKGVLTAYRDAVVDDRLGDELTSVLRALRGDGVYEIGGEHYKRVPAGYDPAHERADLLRYNELWVKAPVLDATEALKPGFVEICFEHFNNMAPLQQWLVKVDRMAT